VINLFVVFCEGVQKSWKNSHRNHCKEEGFSAFRYQYW